ELLVYVSATCPSSKHVSDKLVAITPMNSAGKVRFAKANDTSKDNIQKQHSVLNANSELVCATCHECMFDAIHDLCVSGYLNDVNARVKPKYSWKPTGRTFTIVVCATCHECMFDALHDLCVSGYLNDVNARVKPKSVKSRYAKSKMKKMWKPIGKVYTTIRYSWKPTGQTFTVVGNTCPLTRIISTNVVPPRKSISATLVKQTQPSSNKSGKPKDIKHVGSSSQSKTIGSKISNHSEPMQKWGSKVSTTSSSSRVNFWSYKSYSKTWTRAAPSI
ncbi:hypothetical protein Tco_1258753, partial [Tanacetum coccineum]